VRVAVIFRAGGAREAGPLLLFLPQTRAAAYRSSFTSPTAAQRGDDHFQATNPTAAIQERRLP